MRISLPSNNNKNSKKKIDKTTSGWRDNGVDLTAIICGELIKIDIDNNNIILPNGFIIKCKDIEEAKLKAHEFYGVKYP